MMPRLHVETNQKFSYLVAIREFGKLGNGKITWECRCICGKYVVVDTSTLHRGKKKSCGCMRNTGIAIARTTHGMYGRPTYVSWQNMWTRCSNPAYKQYKDYGGRGVTICERWKVFENFYEDMGIRPEGMSLDRIDVFGNYEPSNCKWSTRSEQNKNTRGAAALRILAHMQQARAKS